MSPSLRTPVLDGTQPVLSYKSILEDKSPTTGVSSPLLALSCPPSPLFFALSPPPMSSINGSSCLTLHSPATASSASAASLLSSCYSWPSFFSALSLPNLISPEPPSVPQNLYRFSPLSFPHHHLAVLLFSPRSPLIFHTILMPSAVVFEPHRVSVVFVPSPPSGTQPFSIRSLLSFRRSTNAFVPTLSLLIRFEHPALPL